ISCTSILLSESSARRRTRGSIRRRPLTRPSGDPPGGRLGGATVLHLATTAEVEPRQPELPGREVASGVEPHSVEAGHSGVCSQHGQNGGLGPGQRIATPGVVLVPWFRPDGARNQWNHHTRSRSGSDGSGTSGTTGTTI